PRIHRYRHHAPRSRRRPNQPKLQPGKRVGGHPAFLLFFGLVFFFVFLLFVFLLVLLGVFLLVCRWGCSILLRVFILSSRKRKEKEVGQREEKKKDGERDRETEFQSRLHSIEFRNRY